MWFLQARNDLLFIISSHSQNRITHISKTISLSKEVTEALVSPFDSRSLSILSWEPIGNPPMIKSIDRGILWSSNQMKQLMRRVIFLIVINQSEVETLGGSA